MRYLHTMVRISDVDASLHFYCDLLGLELVKTIESEKGRFTNYFLCTPSDKERYEATRSPALELTYRPPRDGNMAFGRSPDGISIELLQEGDPLAPAEPWQSMGNTGSW